MRELDTIGNQRCRLEVGPEFGKETPLDETPPTKGTWPKSQKWFDETFTRKPSIFWTPNTSLPVDPVDP